MPGTIPEGYVAFGWYTGGQSLNPRSTNMGVRESVVHLAPREQVAPGLSGVPRRAYEGLCGRRMRARGGHVEDPADLAREVAAGRRTLCQRCVAAASKWDANPYARMFVVRIEAAIADHKAGLMTFAELVAYTRRTSTGTAVDANVPPATTEDPT